MHFFAIQGIVAVVILGTWHGFVTDPSCNDILDKNLYDKVFATSVSMFALEKQSLAP